MDTKAVKYKDGLPILPGAFPIVGHIPAFFRNSIETLCKGHQALGPLFWLRLGFNPLDTQWILTCSGEEGFELLTNQKKARKYVGSTPTILVGESTDWDGATHRRLRTAMGKAFSPRAMTTGQVGNLTADLIASYVNRWVEGRRLPIAREARALTLDIVFRVIGADVADLPEWRKQYHELMLAAYGISIMLPGFPMYRAAKARKWMDARFTSMMNEARGGARAGSFLHTLVTSTDESGQPIPDVDLIDGLRLLGLAAHDSTASMMSWQLIMMAREPKYWEAVLAEAENAAVPTSSDELRQFPFAEGMFREAIRRAGSRGAVS